MPRLSSSTRNLRNWLEHDAKEVRTHHRQLWPHVRDTFEPELYDLALRRSLVALAEQGYGMDEASVMFGVSRQRVQQWCERYGLSERFKAVGVGTKPRLWDAAHNRFVPLRSDDFRRRQQTQAAKLRQAQRRERREYLVLVLVTVADSLGRAPTLNEVAAVFGAWQPLAMLFRGRARDAEPIPWRSLVRRWYRLAGLKVRPVGDAGHIEPRRSMQTYGVAIR